jgi:hypothetical protein
MSMMISIKMMIIDGSPVLGKTADLPEIVAQHEVDIVIFAIDKITPGLARQDPVNLRGNRR